jgi:hypothetical protein
VVPLYVVAWGVVAGAAMVFWSVRRVPPLPVREGALQSKIADLAPGRFRVTGRVVPIHTTKSEIDGAPCVYVERARYSNVALGFLPLLREVSHSYAAHRFYLEDGSGRMLVDPSETLIECATATGDGGLVAERRLRAGEEIELIGRFQHADRASQPDLDEGPYRTHASGLEPAPDDVGPPRISYRTEEGMQRAGPDEMTTFLRGAGAMMIASSLLLASVLLWLQGP